MNGWVAAFSMLLVPLLLAELGEISPWLARRLLQYGASWIGDAEAAERYREEWLAGIEETPGKLIKLAIAASIVLKTVPALHWKFKGYVYRWPAIRTVDLILGTIHRPSSLKFREYIYRKKFLFVLQSNSEGKMLLGADGLKRLIEYPIEGVSDRRLLPRMRRAQFDGLEVVLDWRRCRIYCSTSDPQNSPPAT